LWQSLSQASTEVGISLDIATMMDTWTSQVGFPYLELSLVPGKNELQVTQVRCLPEKPVRNPSKWMGRLTCALSRNVFWQMGINKKIKTRLSGGYHLFTKLAEGSQQ